MGKRQTIGENPLDAFIQPLMISRASETAVLEERVAPPQKKPQSPKKQRITVQISEDVIERVKSAVYWTPGLTLASLAEQAFAKAVDQLERERGSKFQKAEKLRTGRPIRP